MILNWVGTIYPRIRVKHGARKKSYKYWVSTNSGQDKFEFKSLHGLDVYVFDLRGKCVLIQSGLLVE